MMIFDIETNGLLDTVSEIHCISIYDTDTNHYYRFDPISRPIWEGLEMLEKADEICGHNIISYDIPAIQVVCPEFKPKGKVVDTLTWARLTFPDIKERDWNRAQLGRLPGKLIGSHSLEAYGYRFGVFKGSFGKTTDWKEWSPEMSDYCEQDVVVTKKLLEKLQEKGVPEEALDIEHKVAYIIARQERYGVLFDRQAALDLYKRLHHRREELRKELQGKFVPFYKPKGKVFTPKRDNKKMGYVAGCSMTKIELVDFNPASNQHIATVLRKIYRWEPTIFTEKSGDPKIDEDILNSLPYPECKVLAEFQMIEKRIGMLAEGKQAWLKHYNEKTGRIHGAINSNGAVTGRMTHFNPNLGQVPASYSPYGEDCRALFIVPPGRKLVGCDADGLEARGLGHFMARYDDGAYATAVDSGKREDGTDVHTMNQKAIEADSRDNAKTWFYAFIYGAGDEKLGNILGKGKDAGKKSRDKLMQNLPAMGKLTKAVQHKVKAQGFLKGLDGRTLSIRSSHSALNTLIQSSGAVIMKKALIFCEETLSSQYEYGTEYAFVLNVHDEYQIECREEIAKDVAEIAVQSIIKAGEYFNFRCPLKASADVGVNWRETH